MMKLDGRYCQSWAKRRGADRWKGERVKERGRARGGVGRGRCIWYLVCVGYSLAVEERAHQNAAGGSRAAACESEVQTCLGGERGKFGRIKAAMYGQVAERDRPARMRAAAACLQTKMHNAYSSQFKRGALQAVQCSKNAKHTASTLSGG